LGESRKGEGVEHAASDKSGQSIAAVFELDLALPNYAEFAIRG
jgi:hypothetical protein